MKRKNHHVVVKGNHWGRQNRENDAMSTALFSVGTINDKSTSMTVSDGDTLEAKATGGVTVAEEESEPGVEITYRVKEMDFDTEGMFTVQKKMPMVNSLLKPTSLMTIFPSKSPRKTSARKASKHAAHTLNSALDIRRKRVRMLTWPTKSLNVRMKNYIVISALVPKTNKTSNSRPTSKPATCNPSIRPWSMTNGKTSFRVGG